MTNGLILQHAGATPKYPAGR